MAPQTAMPTPAPQTMSPTPAPQTDIPTPAPQTSSPTSALVMPDVNVTVNAEGNLKILTTGVTVHGDEFCDDSDFDYFFVPSIGEFQRCVWLTGEGRLRYMLEICSTPEGRATCPESCGICRDACDDTNEKLFIGDKHVHCLWLRLRPELKEDLCFAGSDAALYCPVSTFDECHHSFLFDETCLCSPLYLLHSRSFFRKPVIFAMVLVMVHRLQCQQHWHQHPLRCPQEVFATMTSTSSSGFQKLVNWNRASGWHLDPSTKRQCAILIIHRERTIFAKKRAANVKMIAKIPLANFTLAPTFGIASGYPFVQMYKR
jgi:hypothetical protein